ncbi:MAG: SMC family ATPase [Lachnospiraceae bacterium]|nr:SMC family ATPase [Lachnospiraceae bacterium]
MKPIKLIMQAFGSYGKKTEIDFGKLHQNLFLITGDTGAGKSTIFDAIVFALYGETGASGKNNRKEGTDLQSQFVNQEVEPFVELTFSTGQGEWVQEYTVHRVPMHFKTLTRGENKGKQARKISGSVTLTMPDGQEYPTKEAGQKIEEIVGLSKEQFMQVAMIAQGEFMELLRTDSNKKKEIFRKLFNTGLYQDIIEEMGNRRREKERDIAKIKTTCQTQISYLICPEEYQGRDAFLEKKDWIEQGKITQMEAFLKELQALCEELVRQKEQAQQQKDQAERLRDEKRDAYQRAESILQSFISLDQAEAVLKECAAQENDILQITKLITSIRDAYAIQLSYQSWEEEQTQLEARRVALQKQLEEEPGLKAEEERLAEEEKTAQQEYATEVERFSQVAERVNKELQQIEKLETAVQSCRKAKKSYEQTVAKEQETAELMQTMEQQERTWKEESQTLQNAGREWESWKAEKETADRLQQEGEELALQQKQLEEKKALWQQKQQEYKQARETFDEENRVYEDQRRAFLDEQAGFLAGALEEGRPCPVCGSLSHPHPAAPSDVAPSREELEQLEKQVAVLRDRQDSLAAEAKAQGEVCREKTAQIDKLQQKWYDKLQEIIPQWEEEQTITAALEKAAQWHETVVKTGRDKQSKLQQWERLQDQLAKLETEKQQRQSALQDIRQQLMQEQSAYETAEALQRELQGLLVYASREEAQTELTGAKERRQNKEQAHRLAAKAREEAAAKLHTAQALIQEYRQSIPEMERKAEQKHLEYQTALSDRKMKEEQWKTVVAQHTQGEEKTLQQEVDDFTHKKVAAESARKTALEATKQAQRPDMNAIREEMQLAEERRKEAEERYQIVLKQYDTDQMVYENLQGEMEHRRQIVEEHGRIDTLYRLLSGNESGSRMDLETFVQRYYLKNILYEANKRFAEMSAGQFAFRMVEDEQAGVGKNRGLDLRVYSAVTGREREIRTLSGGESFLAALSLALGMSDQIRNRSSAIELQMLFIDEGFGSLDDHSRNQAIRVLQEMATGDKLIGIISHVSELKQEIDEQLIVQKQDDGSHIKWQLS